MKEFDLKLYLILESGFLRTDIDTFLDAVLRAGITAIQLRDKTSSANERYATGLIIKKHLSSFNDVLFIVNDRADIAAALGADGVHLGIKDIPLEAVKKIYPHMVLGYSCNSAEDMINLSDADYAGVGPLFDTATKADLRETIGIAGAKRLISDISKQYVVIGGIGADNIKEIKESGIDNVAISSYICGATDPYGTVESILKILA